VARSIDIVVYNAVEDNKVAELLWRLARELRQAGEARVPVAAIIEQAAHEVASTTGETAVFAAVT
jgi:hypothetical protein